MDHVPESTRSSEIIQWIAFERDAEWASKIAILRAKPFDAIAHFGRCRQEHERHAEELAELAKELVPNEDIPTRPQFLTRDALVVGALEDEATLIDTMERLEWTRIGRYEKRRCRRAAGAQPAPLDGLLERHLNDTRDRLASLRRLKSQRH
jgi:hypothetical protein